MRELVILGILMLNVVLQSSVFPFLQISHVKPDSLLMLVISFSLIGGNPIGAVVGFVGGLLQDILFGNNLGLYSLQYMLVGYVAGLVYRKVYIDRLLIPIIFVILLNALKHMVIYIYSFFMQFDISLDKILFGVVIPETLYTIVLMPLVYTLIYRLHQNKFMKRKLWHGKI